MTANENTANETFRDSDNCIFMCTIIGCEISKTVFDFCIKIEKSP